MQPLLKLWDPQQPPTNATVAGDLHRMAGQTCGALV